MRMFGAGTLIAKGSGANPTPVPFGILQEVSLDFSFSLKELYGTNQFPADIGRGTAKIGGKCKFAELNADLFGSVFFNETVSAGQVLVAIGEAGTVPAATTYTITVDNDADFVSDEGVSYTTTGVQFRRVAAAPAIGEYVVNESTGVYTFAAADASAAVLISYIYTSASGGRTFTITNNLLGDAPEFSVLFNGKRNNKQITIELVRCVSSKLTLATKLEDFMIPDFDFSAMANDAGTVGTFSLGT
jgi:hypothetical protein